MAAAASLATRWAILIGVNFYGGAKDLKGCVRDVSTVKQYLEASQHPVDVAILTATAPINQTPRRPEEDPACWPTRANVIQKLKGVLDTAKPGDLVYLHYAGHGTKMSDDLALALLGNDGVGEDAFQGQLLASCLRRMVDKGLLVTVVLDCCFSGSVVRGDIGGTDVRAIDYDSDVDTAFTSDLFADFFDPDHSFRDAAVPPDQWLVNPDGYTILAACGPHEEARELELATGERRGALSYFLMDALGNLGKCGAAVTHESLYEHLRVRFRAFWPQQTPMRYGNKNFTFFGKLGAASDTPYVSIYWKDSRLCLDAGEAHGVHPDDEYAVFPFSLEGVNSQLNTAVTVRVKAVRPLTSDIVIVGPEPTEHVQTGWKAKPVTSLPRRKISVRLSAGAYDHIQQTRDPEEQRWLHLRTENQAGACMFNLTLNNRQAYEILDALLQRIPSLPTVPIDTPDADQHVRGVLQHLAEFKYAEGIENQLPNSSFEACFSLLSSADGAALGTSTVHDIEHGRSWRLMLENHGDSPLYLSMFNFTPSWKISNLLSSAGDSAFRVILPGRQEELKLIMKVPDWLERMSERQCEDVVKVFVTNMPTSFPSLILPELPLHSQHRGSVHKRSEGLLSLIANLTAPSRGQDDPAQEAWAARNFIIRTKLNKNI